MSEQTSPPEPIQLALQECGATALPENATPDQVSAACLKAKEVAVGLEPVLRVGLREALIRELSRAGVKSPAKMADASLADAEAAAKGAGPDVGKGTALSWPEPDPWPEPVDGSAMLNTLVGLFVRYLVLPRYAAHAIALWVVHTWCFGAFDTTPYLVISSATKRCGKTRLVEILRAVVFRALSTASLTEAAMFRSIEEWAPTLLIDEADGVLDVKSELRAVINDGYRRGGGAVRCVGEDHDVRRFSTFCPKVIALIGKVPTTTADRGIQIRMKRRKATENVARLRLATLRIETEKLLRKLARFRDDHLEMLANADPVVPDMLDDRAADFWLPLFAIAEQVGGEWPARAHKTALGLCGNRDRDVDDDELGVELLRDIAECFATARESKLSSAWIVDELRRDEEGPWREFGRSERPITNRGVAKLLRPFGIQSKSVRVREVHMEGTQSKEVEVVRRGYDLDDFVDALERYGITSATPLQGPENPPTGQKNPVADEQNTGQPASASATAKTRPQSGISGVCSTVADEDGEAGRGEGGAQQRLPASPATEPEYQGGPEPEELRTGQQQARRSGGAAR